MVPVGRTSPTAEEMRECSEERLELTTIGVDPRGGTSPSFNFNEGLKFVSLTKILAGLSVTTLFNTLPRIGLLATFPHHSLGFVFFGPPRALFEIRSAEFSRADPEARHNIVEMRLTHILFSVLYFNTSPSSALLSVVEQWDNPCRSGNPPIAQIRSSEIRSRLMKIASATQTQIDNCYSDSVWTQIFTGMTFKRDLQER